MSFRWRRDGKHIGANPFRAFVQRNAIFVSAEGFLDFLDRDRRRVFRDVALHAGEYRIKPVEIDRVVLSFGAIEHHLLFPKIFFLGGVRFSGCGGIFWRWIVDGYVFGLGDSRSSLSGPRSSRHSSRFPVAGAQYNNPNLAPFIPLTQMFLSPFVTNS